VAEGSTQQPLLPAGFSTPPALSSPADAPASRVSAWAWLGSPLALLPLILLALVAIVLIRYTDLAWLGTSFFGFKYFFNPNAPAESLFGVGLFLVDSAIVTVPALLLATGLSLALAIALVVYLPPFPSRILTILTNLLAGIPSVVFGIWGYVVLAPYFGTSVQPGLRGFLGWLPGFGGPLSPGGVGSLLAIFILTIMVIPLTTAVMRESLRNVPRDMVEAGLALGATQWELVRRVRLRAAGRGLWGAVFLGLGRAIGESVAVAMVIGASLRIPPNLYTPSTTLASFIFYQQDSAFFYPYLLLALTEFAIVLMVVALILNIIGQRASGADPTVLVSRVGL
jgi:phosphate transport system permease protein